MAVRSQVSGQLKAARIGFGRFGGFGRSIQFITQVLRHGDQSDQSDGSPGSASEPLRRTARRRRDLDSAGFGNREPVAIDCTHLEAIGQVTRLCTAWSRLVRRNAARSRRRAVLLPGGGAVQSIATRFHPAVRIACGRRRGEEGSLVGSADGLPLYSPSPASALPSRVMVLIASASETTSPYLESISNRFASCGRRARSPTASSGTMQRNPN